jgi:hypothetical protein
MFIFITDQELLTRELMYRIMGCNYSLDQNDILKLVYWFIILFLTIYIFKYFFVVSTI